MRLKTSTTKKLLIGHNYLDLVKSIFFFLWLSLEKLKTYSRKLARQQFKW